MDFNHNTNRQYQHKYEVILNPEEANVFSAAYAEEVYERARMGQSSDEFAVTVAAWDGRVSQNIYIWSTEHVTGVLKRFDERTLGIVASLPETTLVPPFRNRDISLRQKLGAAAAQLAKKLADEQTALDLVTSVFGIPETQR
jgi:hypothetical protein